MGQSSERIGKMDNEESKQAENQWPSVGLAYDFAKSSYDWVQNRFDAANGRIEFLLTFASTVTVAAPVFIKALYTDIGFGSSWFKAAIIVFVLSAIVGIAGRMYGGLKLVSPQTLYDKWLSRSEWEFKKDTIYFAGQHFEYNASQVNKKANLAILMSVLLVAEIVFIVLWVASK